MTRRKPSDTPVYQLLRSEWRRFESLVESVEVSETDLLLYVFWVLEGWMEDEHEADFYADQWDNLYHELRGHFNARGYAIHRGDLALIAHIVFAFALHCLGKAMACSLDTALIYQRVLRGLADKQKDVLQCLGKIREGIYSDALREWMVEYFHDDVFYTMDDQMMWNEDEVNAPQIRMSHKIVNVTENHFERVGSFVNRPQINGREAATMMLNGSTFKALPCSQSENQEDQ